MRLPLVDGAHEDRADTTRSGGAKRRHGATLQNTERRDTEQLKTERIAEVTRSGQKTHWRREASLRGRVGEHVAEGYRAAECGRESRGKTRPARDGMEARSAGTDPIVPLLKSLCVCLCVCTSGNQRRMAKGF